MISYLLLQNRLKNEPYKSRQINISEKLQIVTYLNIFTKKMRLEQTLKRFGRLKNLKGKGVPDQILNV